MAPHTTKKFAHIALIFRYLEHLSKEMHQQLLKVTTKLSICLCHCYVVNETRGATARQTRTVSPTKRVLISSCLLLLQLH